MASSFEGIIECPTKKSFIWKDKTFGWIGMWASDVANQSHAVKIQLGKFVGMCAPWDDGVFGPTWEASALDEDGNVIGHGTIQWRQEVA